jgi:predicted permease
LHYGRYLGIIGPMFTISFQTAVLAIVQIFAMGAIGFFLVRRKIMDEMGLKLLSFLSVNICFPFFIFYQITHHFNPVQTPLWWAYPLINISLILTGLIVAVLWSLTRKKPLKEEFLAASAMHNAGYIPLMMVSALPLGEASGNVYAAVILSVIGFDTCLWSLGVWLMTRHQNPQVDLKKMINPPLISMAAAIALVLVLGHGLEAENLLKPVKMIGDSALALAMIVIGGNLAMTNLAGVRFERLAPVLLIKLMALPLLALIVLPFLHLDPIMNLVVIIQACMPTSITLSIIGRNYNTGNQEFVNQSIFFTHVCCIFTVPIFLAVYGKWVH